MGDRVNKRQRREEKRRMRGKLAPREALVAYVYKHYRCLDEEPRAICSDLVRHWLRGTTLTRAQWHLLGRLKRQIGRKQKLLTIHQEEEARDRAILAEIPTKF